MLPAAKNFRCQYGVGNVPQASASPLTNTFASDQGRRCKQDKPSNNGPLGQQPDESRFLPVVEPKQAVLEDMTV